MALVTARRSIFSARAAGARGRGAHRREQTDPPQPPVRAPTERLAAAAADSMADSMADIRCGADDGARAMARRGRGGDDEVRRPRRGRW